MAARIASLVVAAVLAAGSGSDRPARREAPMVVGGGGGGGPVRVVEAPPATGGTIAGGGGGAGGAAEELEFCVDETNRYRATVGLPAVRRSAELEKCAAEAAREDAASQQPHGHFVRTSGCGVSFAENEIPWWPSDFAGGLHATIQQGLAQMWGEGRGGGHYENMTGPYGELGCGVYEAGGAITVVQEYR
jgi:hypothetical protein